MHGECGDMREQHYCGYMQCWISEVGEQYMRSVREQFLFDGDWQRFLRLRCM